MGLPASTVTRPPSSAAVSAEHVRPANMEEVVQERKRQEASEPLGSPSPKAPRMDQIQAVQQYLPGGDMDETLEDEIDASWADDEPEKIHEDGEPELSPDELEEANRLADQTEMDRLESMGVYENISQDEIGDSVVLTCRFVYDWRRDHLTQQWCRRSRLVSREFRYNDPRRTDLFASTLPPYAAKVLVSWGLANGYSFATADISDAFLMVKQTVPTVVRLPGTDRWARLHRLLPGQRAAAHDHATLGQSCRRRTWFLRLHALPYSRVTDLQLQFMWMI